jgi:hypothetical protein
MSFVYLGGQGNPVPERRKRKENRDILTLTFFLFLSEIFLSHRVIILIILSQAIHTTFDKNQKTFQSNVKFSFVFSIHFVWRVDFFCRFRPIERNKT